MIINGVFLSVLSIQAIESMDFSFVCLCLILNQFKYCISTSLYYLSLIYIIGIHSVIFGLFCFRLFLPRITRVTEMHAQILIFFMFENVWWLFFFIQFSKVKNFVSLFKWGNDLFWQFFSLNFDLNFII